MELPAGQGGKDREGSDYVAFIRQGSSEFCVKAAAEVPPLPRNVYDGTVRPMASSC